ncbi:MAG: diguanylate cyclase [Prolixibacteraceae bacterium]|nr:diguanylate cyclase [Prolixibacteraceae bacterium]
MQKDTLNNTYIMTDSFLTKLDNLIEKVKKMFISLNAFQKEIEKLIIEPESSLEGLLFTLIIKSENKLEIPFGVSQNGEPSDIKTIQLSASTDLKYKLWKKNGGDLNWSQDDEIILKISELIYAYWKLESRDKFNILAFKSDNQYLQANQYIKYCLEDYKFITVLFCDLDKFKEVNDRFGMSVGDGVIEECIILLQKVVSKKGVVVHRQAGGDEFIILYPTNSTHEALLISEYIFDEFKSYNFRIDDVKIGLSIGISFTSKDNSTISINDLAEKAEKAIKVGNNVKLRGKYRFSKQSYVIKNKLSDTNLNSAICFIKSNLDNPELFNSPWLALISDFTFSYFEKGNSPFDNDLFNKRLTELTNHISPEIQADSLMCLENNDSVILSPEMSYLDIAFAISFAIFRYRIMNKEFIKNDNKVNVKYSEVSKGIVIYSEPNRLLEIDLLIDGDLDKELDLGFMVNIEEKKNEKISLTKSFRRALLIDIGHNPHNFSKEIFSDIIVIDDRPVRGGGLPDFWESTISRLISLVKNNSNVENVYVLGDKDYASKTIEKLKDIVNWDKDLEQISYKTGQKISNIKYAIGKLSNKISFHSDEQELLYNLATLYKSEFTSKYSQKSVPSNLKNNLLSRDIIMKSISLRNKDGCIVKSIKEAFPIVLEIARKSEEDNAIFDQAGQELKELIDFKVLLSDPQNDMIPSFYEQDKESMEKYFHDQFIDPNGLFRIELNENQQYDAVVNHVSKIIASPEKQFATRRAILVIPHKITKPEDISPLGLVSIRIIARFVKRKILLGYSYTWRTVEALVGFPYSIYGSVRFSQEITEDIKCKVPLPIQKQIEMGEVSYIAHSLHIFMDEYGQNIAKSIVDEASD